MGQRWMTGIHFGRGYDREWMRVYFTIELAAAHKNRSGAVAARPSSNCYGMAEVTILKIWHGKK